MFEGRCCYYWVMRRNVVIQRACKMDRMKGILGRVIIALSNYQLKTPCSHPLGAMFSSFVPFDFQQRPALY